MSSEQQADKITEAAQKAYAAYLAAVATMDQDLADLAREAWHRALDLQLGKA